MSCKKILQLERSKDFARDRFRCKMRTIWGNKEADPAPRGGIRGPCPPTECLCPPNENWAPPSEDCAPKKLTGSGLLERKSRSKIVFLVDWHLILWRFGDADLFFFSEIICFRPEKTLEFAISAGKSLWLFAPHLVHFIQTGMNFSCSCAPLDFTQNKLLVPPQIYLCPPSHAILAPGLQRGVPNLCCTIPLIRENRFTPFNFVTLATLRFEISWHHKRMTLENLLRISYLAVFILQEIL